MKVQPDNINKKRKTNKNYRSYIKPNFLSIAIIVFVIVIILIVCVV